MVGGIPLCIFILNSIKSRIVGTIKVSFARLVSGERLLNDGCRSVPDDSRYMIVTFGWTVTMLPPLQSLHKLHQFTTQTYLESLQA